MQHIMQRLETADWNAIARNMDDKGYAIIENLLTVTDCEALKYDYYT